MVQAYNYMLGSLPVKRNAKYPTSKKNELRRVYNSIVNLSKRSPFYKISLTKENLDYTIGVKENALALKAKILDMADPAFSGFDNKKVTVSDEGALSAKLLNADTDTLPETIQLKVKSLATVQINHGKELLKTSRGLPGGEYSFQAKIGENTFQLTFLQDGRKENQEALNNMADLLNVSLKGIHAVVEQGASKDYQRLTILSELSGKFGDKKFSFEDEAEDSLKPGVADYFGMNRMEQAADYAGFELNGVERKTATNTFTLENTLCITLNNSSEKPAIIKIVPDSEKILTAVKAVLESYNDLIHLAKDRTLGTEEHYKATKLIGEMKGLEEEYQEELSACGLSVSEDAVLSLEEPLASQSAEDGGMESLFTRKNGFIEKLLGKTEAIAINPMEYLDKTIVIYPNNKNLYRNPYVTSMYSGLFFNSYC